MVTRLSIFRNVRNDRQFRASTGLSKEEFLRLGQSFSQLYKPELYQVTEDFSIGKSIQDPFEGLFLILYYKKNYPTFDVLGLCFGLSNSAVHKYVQMFKSILRQCLVSEDVLPKRIFANEQEMRDFFGSDTEILVDATERPTQRPNNEELQKERYSGKKKLIP